MPEENITKSDMNIIIVIDKDKLPEELRDKLPQDLQNKLIELLQEETNSQQNKFGNSLHRDDQPSNLFSVQHGTVIGNIYKDNIVPMDNTVPKEKVHNEKKVI